MMLRELQWPKRMVARGVFVVTCLTCLPPLALQLVCGWPSGGTVVEAFIPYWDKHPTPRRTKVKPGQAKRRVSCICKSDRLPRRGGATL